MPLTEQSLVAVGCAPAAAKDHFPHVVDAMLAQDINTDVRARYFLCQALHECGCLKWMEEIWGPTAWQRNYEGSRTLGNTQSGDGFRFRGRGPFMLTGRNNYIAYGELLGRPYKDNPDLVGEPHDGWQVAARYWTEKSLNALADKGDARGITRAINGQATDGPPSHHLDRMAIYARLPADCSPTAPDPYACLIPEERAAVEALDAEARSAQRHGGWDKIDASHLAHATQLRAQIETLRKAIWHAAESEPNGWNVKRRRKRYDLLKQKGAE
jgi:predicted chitinase